MKRFSFAYNMGDKRNINDVDFKDLEMKIIDNMGLLPDLIVTDEETARKYLTYLNRGLPEEEVDSKIINIKNGISNLNDLNEELIRPDYEIIVDEDTEDAKYSMSTEKQLFLEGYRHRISKDTNLIYDELDSLKDLLLD